MNLLPYYVALRHAAQFLMADPASTYQQLCTLALLRVLLPVTFFCVLDCIDSRRIQDPPSEIVQHAWVLHSTDDRPEM